MVLAIGQDNAFPFIERNIGLEFGKWDMPVVDKTTFMSTRPGVFFGGDAAFGPANIIWAVEHGHQAAISIHNYCQGIPVTERPAQGLTLTSTKMGLHQWAYSNNYDHAPRQKMKHVDLGIRFQSMTTEVEKGFSLEQTTGGSGALPELRRADPLHRIALHRVRCVRGHLSGGLPDHHAEPVRARDADAVPGAGAQPRSAALRVRRAQADRPGDGEGREHLPALRAVRGAVPDLRVGHAEVRAQIPYAGATVIPLMAV